MAKVIIGIHGLSNKPQETQLHEWWLKAINDGLAKVGGTPVSAAQFKLAYWADLMYPTFDPNPEPYTEPNTDEVDDDPSKLIDVGREFFSDIIGKFGDVKVQMTDSERIEGIKNAMREKIVEDLAAYYDDNSTIQFTNRAGTQTRTALRAVLRELIEQHQADDLLVIGHSMGSIIAYDVLRSLRDTAVKVRRLVTIGSPLGLANVKAKTRTEWDDKDGPFVPEVLTEGWANYGDRKDLVCADLTLDKEYKSSGGFSVQDVFISNGYRHRKHNHHKSYGYLRTDPLAGYLKGFLAT
ncbi:MAG: thioesterase domain-containing protein [Pseudomonadota bacterium]|nr:thioesterase domain-containing protein [Pseudomonadota bacterium]